MVNLGKVIILLANSNVCLNSTRLIPIYRGAERGAKAAPCPGPQGSKGLLHTLLANDGIHFSWKHTCTVVSC